MNIVATPSAVISKSAYQTLLKRVRAAIQKGKARVEREKIRTYWQVGCVIHRFILKDRKRAPLGQKLFTGLARDLKVTRSSLYHSLEFYRAYPVFSTWRKLSWSHYKYLLTVNDPLKREVLERKAEKFNWSISQLNKQIRKEKPAGKAKLLKPKRGIVGARRVVKIRDKLAWDLGFTAYKYISAKPKRYSEPPAADLFTFKGHVECVVDGDTVWCQIELGYRTCVREKLRLRDVSK